MPETTPAYHQNPHRCLMQTIPEGDELLLEAGDAAFLSTGAGWVLVVVVMGRLG